MFAAVFRAYLHLVWSHPGLGHPSDAARERRLATELEYINF